jgi:hypothetical protein
METGGAIKIELTRSGGSRDEAWALRCSGLVGNVVPGIYRTRLLRAISTTESTENQRRRPREVKSVQFVLSLQGNAQLSLQIRQEKLVITAVSVTYSLVS